MTGASRRERDSPQHEKGLVLAIEATRPTRAWLAALGLVDIGLGVAILLFAMTPPGLVALLGVLAAAILVRRCFSVRAELRGNALVVRNRWLTHRLLAADVDELKWSRLGLGVGPTVVSVRTQRRLSPLYPLKELTIEATATFDVDAMNNARQRIAGWLGRQRP